MKIREVLRSDLVNVMLMYAEWQKGQGESPPYPLKNIENMSQEYNWFLMQQLRNRDAMENEGKLYPWEIFVAIPQGNVVKGYIEVLVEPRAFGLVKVVCRIGRFIVDEKSRGLDIGKPLFQRALAFGAQFGAQSVEVTTPIRGKDHEFWAKVGARSYSTNLVFAKDNWNLFDEGDLEWASDRMQGAMQIGSMETKIPKVPQESIEIPSKERPDLILAKG